MCPIMRLPESGRTSGARLRASSRLSATGFSSSTVLPASMSVRTTGTCAAVVQATTQASAADSARACFRLVQPGTPGSSGPRESRLACLRATSATRSASANRASVRACSRPKRPSPITPTFTGAKLVCAIVALVPTLAPSLLSWYPRRHRRNTRRLREARLAQERPDQVAARKIRPRQQRQPAVALRDQTDEVPAVEDLASDLPDRAGPSGRLQNAPPQLAEEVALAAEQLRHLLLAG